MMALPSWQTVQRYERPTPTTVQNMKKKIANINMFYTTHELLLYGIEGAYKKAKTKKQNV